MAVVDASVQVALLNTAGPHHPAAFAWYRSALLNAEALTAPWILVAEVSAALSRGLGDARLAHLAVDRILSDAMVRLVVVDEALATRAAALAADQRLRGCDAVYVALATDLGEPLVTLDRQQSERAARIVEVVTPGPSGM